MSDFTPDELRQAADNINKLTQMQKDYDARIAALEAALPEQEKNWYENVERKLDEISRGSIVQDNLKEAIPQRWRGKIASAEYSQNRLVAKDPVKACAYNSWLQLKALCDISKGPEAAQYREELDRLNRVLNETNNDDGGYIVPTPLEAMLTYNAGEVSFMRNLITPRTMTSDSVTIPYSSGITVSWTAEQSTTQSETEFGLMTLSAKKLTALGYASTELIEDKQPGLDLLNWYLDEAARQIYLAEEDEILEGDGTNFTGLGSATGVNETALSGVTSASGITGGLAEMYYKPGKTAVKDGAWVMHPAHAAYLDSLVDSDGRRIYNDNDAGFARFAARDQHVVATIRNSPVYLSEEISIAGTDGNIYYAPFNRAVILADRTGIEFKVSEHYKLGNDLLTFLVRKRTGILVIRPFLCSRGTNLITKW